VVALLEKYILLVRDTPPIEQPMRFGNKAFQAFLDKLYACIQEDLKTLSSEQGFERAIPEIAVYLQESFGEYTRLDYGTGHELNFVAFLFCLFKVGVLLAEDLKAGVNCIFNKYMEAVRLVQQTYQLEPAGSHGVWGLDDYHHLAFLFGASQLCQSLEYTPESIHTNAAMKDTEDYMYFACIAYIKSVKKCPFWEGSPMLNDISAVPSWEKVAKGMMAMFLKEVAGKHPVIKHLKFGSLLVFNP
jgi:serine/threonine-protein phosphatase 2A activator